MGVKIPGIAVLELGYAEAGAHKEASAGQADGKVEDPPFDHWRDIHDSPPHEASLVRNGRAS